MHLDAFFCSHNFKVLIIFERYKIIASATEGLVQQQFAKMAVFGLNLKLVLYLQSQCLTKSLGFLNPPLLQAAKS
jgi:hypothetical protein